MLDRYTSSRMRSVWEPQAAFAGWRAVELAVLDARVALGEAPESAAATARNAPIPALPEIGAAEARTKHDVVAFLDVWTNTMPDEAACWVHRGLTSSDIVDTGLALQLTAASDLLVERATGLVIALSQHAIKHRDTGRIGRTHGMHATPDTWGHRVADFALAADRARTRLLRARAEVAKAKISGPTGSYAHVSPEVEQRAAHLLGLEPAEVGTQVVMRDRIAEWVCALALMASVCESIALEVRHSQRTEVDELAEGFTSGQTGSSAMPHKKNPITAEKICGLARIARSFIVPVMEGIPLWHERDISHSSVERICLPDAAAVVEHIMLSSTTLAEELVVKAEHMSDTLDAAYPSALSESAVVALMAAGVRREPAHAKVIEALADAPSTPEFVARIEAALSATAVTLDADWHIVRRPERLAPVFERLEHLLETLE
ncbi:adenylosuccinate lyase [Amycolatopsis sp. NPDC088138]|uniref:adenylosuccinate lyase n=1 Tax=Amycolatopsis sp. NPDC088138 TaxID=3363938 RepID=UPI003809279E